MDPIMIATAQLISTVIGALALVLMAAFIAAVYAYDRKVRRRNLQFSPEITGLDGRQIPSMGFEGPFQPGA